MKATPTTKIVSPPINNVSKKPLPSDISLILSSETSTFNTSLVNGHLPHGYYPCRPDCRRFRHEMTPPRVQIPHAFGIQQAVSERDTSLWSRTLRLRRARAEVNNSVTIAGATCESLIEQQRMEYMDTTTSLSPIDSAHGTGRLKSSILSAITSCRVNGTRGEFGQLRIETEELRRELAETRTRSSVAEQRVADLSTMLNDIREQRDRWQAQADRLGSLLTDQGRRGPRWWRWRRPKRNETRLQITDMRENPGNLKS